MTAPEPQPFSIGPARIEHGAPVYIIAEIGVNHDGQLHLARELIHAAADAEADAVKFQVFAADRLVRRDTPSAGYQLEATSLPTQYELLKNLELTHDQYAELFSYAGHCGVEFLATPFSRNDLRFLVDLGVRALKLASPDIVNRPLLEEAAASGLPVIASTGAAQQEEIAEAVDLFNRHDTGPFALLHCISSYPTSEQDANLRAIRTLSRTFRCPAGFSDHTESLTIGGYAAAAGALIIEKHMTLSRTRCGPDHAFSLEPEQMARYIRHIREVEGLLGDGRLTSAECEADIRRLARRSVVAARDIHEGEIIERDMLALKRPGDGIDPRQMEVLIGRTALEAIPADTLLTWSQLSGTVRQADMAGTA